MLKTVYPDETINYNEWMQIIHQKKTVEVKIRDISIRKPLGFFMVDKPGYVSNFNLLSRLFKSFKI